MQNKDTLEAVAEVPLHGTRQVTQKDEHKDKRAGKCDKLRDLREKAKIQP